MSTIAPIPKPSATVGYFLGYWTQFYVVSSTGAVLSSVRLTGNLNQQLALLQSQQLPDVVLSMIKDLESQGLTQLILESSYLENVIRKSCSLSILVKPGNPFPKLKTQIFTDKDRPSPGLAINYSQERLMQSLREPEKVLYRLLRDYHQFEYSRVFYQNRLRESAILYYSKLVQDTPNDSDFNTELHRILENVLSPAFDPKVSTDILVSRGDKIGLFSVLKIIEIIQLQQIEVLNSIGMITVKIAPNLTELVGVLLASELIVASYSLANLAKMPAGRIQIMGSKHGRGTKRGPKYGILYISDWLTKVEPKYRGELARTLSAQIAIAVKADYYTHNKIVEPLKLKLEKRVRQLEASK